jgi:hypothetical protein
MTARWASARSRHRVVRPGAPSQSGHPHLLGRRTWPGTDRGSEAVVLNLLIRTTEKVMGLRRARNSVVLI